MNSSNQQRIVYGLAIVGAIVCLLVVLAALLIGGRFILDLINDFMSIMQRPQVSLVCGILFIACTIAIFLIVLGSDSSKKDLDWNLQRESTVLPVETDDGQFHLRVAALVKKQTGYEVTPVGDVLRVYKRHKLVGLVRCCRFAKMATPDMIQELVALAHQEHVEILYFVSGGHVGRQVERAAGLHKVKLLAL